jgi:Xaa-Pro aminopeptidase
VTTYLLYDDSIRSPELRHEIAEAIADPVIFVDDDGRRVVVASTLEAGAFREREDVVDVFWNFEELGYFDLVRDTSLDRDELGAELVLRALKKLGASTAVVPPTFRINVADHLRKEGIDVVVDSAAWNDRRRKKTPWELEGIERAQRATETAMLSAARMLREAEPTSSGTLRFEGETLTAEWIREVMVGDLLSQGAESEEILIQSGDACLDGHGLGLGPILPNQSCIIDCFPRDRRTGAYTDMTRTFVPGEPSDELKRIYSDVREAMDIALETVRPGSDAAFKKVSDFFHSKGYPTRLHSTEPGAMVEGFPYGLGHGVGLQVHERPGLGIRSDPLVERDVIAVEPGLYFEGVGGVRLEDTVLVTDNGPVHFTDPFPYELQP